MDQVVGRGGRPAIADMTVSQVCDIDPSFCQRLHGLGLTEPLLCGLYLHRTLAELASAEHLDVRMLLAVMNGNRTSQPTPLESHPVAQRELPGPRLAATTTHLNLGHEIEQLRAEPAWKDSDRNAKTLIKGPELRVVLVALKASARLEQHWAAGPITVQALAGRLRLRLPEQVLELVTGEIAALGPAIRHDVEALEPSVFLLTIALPESGGHGSDQNSEQAVK
ncbi:MAG: cupin domain-containing protein [Chloroflexota bacterium]